MLTTFHKNLKPVKAVINRCNHKKLNTNFYLILIDIILFQEKFEIEITLSIIIFYIILQL